MSYIKKPNEERYARFASAVNSLKLDFPGAEISRRLELSDGGVSEMLRGKKKLSEEFVRKFCKEFDQDFAWIWKGEQKKGSSGVDEPDIPYSSREFIMQQLMLTKDQVIQNHQQMEAMRQSVDTSLVRMTELIGHVAEGQNRLTVFLVKQFAVLENKPENELKKDLDRI